MQQEVDEGAEPVAGAGRRRGGARGRGGRGRGGAAAGRDQLVTLMTFLSL